MLKELDELLWGPGTLILLLGTGIYLNIRTGFLPCKNLGYAIKSALGQDARRSGRSGVSPFSSLMTALAATLGTGNIVGVATALVAGGPGALIWMELSALIGMGIILAESTLAVKYHRFDRQGQRCGGPMYVMSARLGPAGKCMGVMFALFATGASLGIGSMTQANAAAAALKDTLSVPPHLTGAVLSALALCIILGGIRNISRITTVLVPALALLYMAAGLSVIIANLNHLPEATAEMFRQAFSFRAAAGGTAGFAAMRWGIARGVFSNEAGLGSSSIAAAAAETDHPVRQGYISMTGPFFDTIVLCTVTGLAICCSGMLGATDSHGTPVDGAALTILAFESALGPWSGIFVALAIAVFAFSTIIGWEYLGETAFSFLSGGRFIIAYRFLFALAALIGASASLYEVFCFSDICNALMCIPNLLCLLLLSDEVRQDIRAYERIKSRKKL